MPRRKEKTELLRGTLDMLILRTLSLRPLHGVSVAERIKQITGGTFDVPAGSLFPALHRLEMKRWIIGEWSTNGEGKRVKSYQLTTAGRRQLSDEKRQWDRIVAAIAQVFDTSN